MASPKIIVESPLGKDVFMLRHMTGQDELGRLFNYELELLSTKRDIAVKDVLGKFMVVHLDLPSDKTRHFHGLVSELAYTGNVGRHAQYRVTLKPWLWFLTRSSNSRIFQNVSIPDIIKQVFRDRGFSDFDDALGGTHKPHDYVVQYRETDFNFVSRLMEQEGIYYYFRHEQGKHTLVLSDGYGAHHAVPDYEEIPYYPPDESGRRERECIDGWQLTHHVQPGKYVLDDYNFKTPKDELLAKLASPHAHDHDDFEMYDYPGAYQAASDGENYVKVRLEELHADFERTSGQGNTRGLFAGALFKLTDYPRKDQNQEYLITSAHYELNVGEHESMGSGTADDGPMFRVGLSAIKGATQYRPARITPKPVVAGPQTAKVVGKAGEEIWTDEHGRVKVHFHWDRGDTKNEGKSCWVRVAQVWAGAGWGAMHVPRIGQEVVVSFLEGDPDRPLITGRVYNGVNKPPFALPGKAMVSGIKSDSTPGGGGNNEISFDDTKGAEKLNIHGQFDMATAVGHDEKHDVTNNRTTSVGVDDTESVGGNQKISVTGTHTLDVTQSQTTKVGTSQDITVGAGGQTSSIAGNHSLSVSQASTETVTLAKALTVGLAYQVSVGAAMNETVGAAKIQEIVGLKSVNVGAASSEIVVGPKSLSAASITETAKSAMALSGGSVSVKSKSDLALTGKKGVVELSSELTIKCGSASITLKSGGEIVIKGKKVTIDGGPEIVLKGSKISQN